MENNTITDSLKRHFYTLDNQTNDWNFFLGLADYFKFVDKTAKLIPAIKAIQKEGEFDEHQLHDAENKAEMELMSARDKLLRVIKGLGLNSEIIYTLCEDLKGYTRVVNSQRSFSQELFSTIGKILENLFEEGYYTKLTEWASPQPNNHKEIWVFKYAPRYLEYITTQENYDLYKETHLWYPFEQLIWIFRVIHRREDEKALASEKSPSGIVWFNILKRELEKAKAGEKSALPRAKYKSYIEKIHNYFLDELSKLPSEVAKQIKIIDLFLENNGDLWREPKTKYCYPMMTARERLNLVKYLAKHQGKDYIETKVIASALTKEVSYIRSEIGKINLAAKKNLKLELIDSKQGSGYRISPKIKIKILTR